MTEPARSLSLVEALKIYIDVEKILEFAIN